MILYLSIITIANIIIDVFNIAFNTAPAWTVILMVLAITVCFGYVTGRKD